LNFTASREHRIHLRLDLTVVGHVGIEKRLQFQIFLFHFRGVVDQLHAMVVEDLVELGDLVVAKLQLRSDIRVFPPLAHVRAALNEDAFFKCCRLGGLGLLGGSKGPDQKKDQKKKHDGEFSFHDYSPLGTSESLRASISCTNTAAGSSAIGTSFCSV